MASTGKPVAKRKQQGSPHHERYPQRMQAHLASAVEAAQAIESPPANETADPTPAALVSRYGATDEPKGAENGGD